MRRLVTGVFLAGAAARADFALKARGAAGPHLNKNGEQYGRYK